MLGLTKNFEKNIIVRKTKEGLIPISYYEYNMKPFKNGKVLTDLSLYKWFIDTTLDEVTKELLGFKDINDVVDIMFKYRKSISEVIERIDRDSINLKDLIIRRISARLL